MHLFQAGLVKCAKESVIRKIFGNLFVKRDSNVVECIGYVRQT